MFIKKKKKEESQIIIQVSTSLQFPKVTLLGRAKATEAESSLEASSPSLPASALQREDLQ